MNLQYIKQEAASEETASLLFGTTDLIKEYFFDKLFYNLNHFERHTYN